MKATWVQTNFNAGEWSPWAYGRFDLARYKNALAECLNFVPLSQGPLTRRAGTRYVAAVKDSAYAPRLQRFEFSTTQAYILEFGHEYVRFYTNDGQLLSGGVPYEVATPYSSSDVWGLTFAQSADTLYIAHPGYAPRKLQRAGATSWTLTEIDFQDGPYLPLNLTATTLTPSDTTGEVTVTASGTAGINDGAGFRSTDVGRMLRLKCGGVWLWGKITEVTDTTHVKWLVGSTGGGSIPTTATGLANVSGGSVFSIAVTNGGSGYGVQPPSVGFAPAPTTRATFEITLNATGGITEIGVLDGGSGYASAPTLHIISSGGLGCTATCTLSGDAVDAVTVVKPGRGYTEAAEVLALGGGSPAGSGAVAYAGVTNGVVTSVAVSVTGTGYSAPPDVTFTAPGGVVAATTNMWRLGVWNSTDGYPACVMFHQDRLWWAGSTSAPGRMDSSNSGDYETMSPTNLDGTVVDSHALSFSLNSGTVNAITWMVSDEWGLLVGTAGGEWSISPSNSQQAITPTNICAKQLSSYGSSAQSPVRIGKSTMFVQRTKRKVRELFYQFTYNTFQAVDVSLLGEHLTASGIKQMALQLAPYQTIWMSRNDGALVGLTFDRDQEICGWHRHSLGGYSDEAQTLPPEVESVAVIPSPDVTRDEPWFVVKRYIDGAVVRYVERAAKTWEDGDTSAEAVFVDSSAEYSGAATTTISGLTWLKGQTVGVLTNGAVHPDCVVSSSGTITLQRSATVAQVGLKYQSRAKTMPIEAGGQDGPSQGKLKRVHRAVVRFFQSIGISMGSSLSGDTVYPQPFRTSADPMDGPVSLFSGDKRWAYEGTWDTNGQVLFEATDPLPCNVTMLMAQLETQDNL